jgi:hypothetical protein
MAKDRRYKTLKILIEGGHIKELRQMFDHIPKSVVSQDLGMNYERFVNKINHIELFTLKELFLIMTFIGVDEKLMLELAFSQYLADKKKKLKK